MKWCQWILSIPKRANPTFDDSGILAKQSQIDPAVIFLCQTYESVPSTPTRTVEIPYGTSIFMPIINWIDAVRGKETIEADIKKLAATKIDEVVKLQVHVNGKPIHLNLWNFRVQSPTFDITLPHDNIFDMAPGKSSIIADGFWIFFQPLVRNLRIETFGACRSGITQIAVSYHLNS